MRAIGIVFGLLAALPVGTAPARDDSRVHPGAMQVVDIERAKLKEIIPEAVAVPTV